MQKFQTVKIILKKHKYFHLSLTFLSCFNREKEMKAKHIEFDPIRNAKFIVAMKIFFVQHYFLLFIYVCDLSAQTEIFFYVEQLSCPSWN